MPTTSDVRRGELLLRVRPELVEQDVAAVAKELGVVHGGAYFTADGVNPPRAGPPTTTPGGPGVCA